MKEQFARTLQLVRPEGFERLQDARVAVCGLGAVGGFAVEALARSGIGHLTLIDFDTFDLSNLNRQVLALHSTVGASKAEVARARVQDIHPDCVVEIRKTFIEEATLPELLADRPDVVLDAIDGLNSKVMLIRYALEKDLFIASSMGAAARFDAGCIEVADIAKTHHCPLARAVRRRLHRFGIEKGVPCVFSAEASFNTNEPVIKADSGALQERGRVRPSIGSLAHVTGSFGLRLAGVAIDHLLHGGTGC